MIMNQIDSWTFIGTKLNRQITMLLHVQKGAFPFLFQKKIFEDFPHFILSQKFGPKMHEHQNPGGGLNLHKPESMYHINDSSHFLIHGYNPIDPAGSPLLFIG